MARTATSSAKEKLNKGQIAKIAEESARKAVKKTATKVAKQEATRVAQKVATEAALNPDYELNDDEDVKTGLFASWDSDEDEEEEEEEYEQPSSYRQGLSFSSSVSDDEEEEDEITVDLSKDIKNRDIFAYANDLMNKGTPVRLQIKKNGQFLTTVKKPYSEEQLQKDHGEGHYSVILRNDVKGTFIKQQSFSIAAPPAQPTEIAQQHVAKQEEKLDRMFNTFAEMQSAQTESQNSLFERLLEEQRRREDEEKERRREERELMKYNEQNNNSVLASVLQAALAPRDNDGGSMSAIIQVMQSQQNQTTQMIMESNKNFMMMIQEMRRDSQTMLEKITQAQTEQAREFRHQLSEMSGKKSNDGFDPITMFKMLNDTREAGMNFGLKINDLAKQIAESDIQPSQPKTIVESVLDNLGKFAPLMLAAGQQSNASAHFQQAPVAQIQAPVQAPVSQQAYRQQAKPAQKVAPKAPEAAPKAPVKTVASGAKPVIMSKTLVKSNPKQTTTQTVVASNQESGKIESDVELKSKVIDICVPLIGHALQNGINSGGLGDASINAFASQGIDPKKAVELVGVEDIYDLAFKTYSLPDMPELRHYLKDYHDYLREKTSSGQLG
jgi:hypothetical protein